MDLKDYGFWGWVARGMWAFTRRGHPFYVDVFEHAAGRDPTRHLVRRIELAESESVNLLTGFRGNGKSTHRYCAWELSH